LSKPKLIKSCRAEEEEEEEEEVVHLVGFYHTKGESVITNPDLRSELKEIKRT
jgi:hypothetical protein